MGLTGNDLLVYSIIFSFTNDGESRYYGTQGYIAKVLGLTRRSVINIFNRLLEQNYIVKHQSLRDSSRFEYAVNPDTCWLLKWEREQLAEQENEEFPQDEGGCEEISQGGVKKFHRGCEEISHDIIIDNILLKKERNIIKKEKAEEHSASNQPNLVVEHSTDMPKGGEAKAAAKEDAEEIYKLYPTTCLNTGRRTGKSTKDKEKIVRLLKKHTKEELKFTIQKYIELSVQDKTYMMNFSTFLNNLPDYSDLIEKEKEKETKLELDQPVFVEI